VTNYTDKKELDLKEWKKEAKKKKKSPVVNCSLGAGGNREDREAANPTGVQYHTMFPVFSRRACLLETTLSLSEEKLFFLTYGMSVWEPRVVQKLQ